MKTDNQNKENSWETIQENLADKTGLAVIVVEGEDARVVAKSNNNSICEMLYASAEFAPKCAMFCGKAFATANEAGKPVAVKCHANLNFYAVPLKTDEMRPLAAIVGRTFLKAEDYREAAERAMAGDWQQFPADQLFKNVLLTSSAGEVERAVKRLEKLSEEKKELFLNIGHQPTAENEEILPEKVAETSEQKTQADEIAGLIEQFHQNKLPAAIVNNPVTEKNLEEAEEVAAWRSLFNSLLDLSYKDACQAVLGFLANRHNLAHLAWLECENGNFRAIWANGNLKGQQIQITIASDDPRLFEALQKETALEFRERKNPKDHSGRQNINLFPMAVGGTINSALIVGDKINNEDLKRHIARFMRTIAPELEILRLREEIGRQSWATRAIQKLNETLKNLDAEDFWNTLAQVSAELMGAEQGSLLIFDNNSQQFMVKAAIGSRADIIKKELPARIGQRVAQNVMLSGKPLVVSDTHKIGLEAPVEWKYKTNSFISYPIVISGRKIGVLNISDKIGGGSYDESDLERLNTLIPQIAVALDRVSLMRKAGEFEQLSITDALTGLVNRRYLEERLAEEIRRSQRHGYPLSFMMIDADSFKAYNDTFLHTEGDKALQIIAQCLKATLRGDDVAVRYGGEEFSILLPQTTSSEALIIAERLRQKIEKVHFPNRQVTVSIGVATISKALQTPQDLISAADTALYEAKRKGRNNVKFYQMPVESNE